MTPYCWRKTSNALSQVDGNCLITALWPLGMIRSKWENGGGDHIEGGSRSFQVQNIYFNRNRKEQCAGDLGFYFFCFFVVKSRF